MRVSRTLFWKEQTMNQIEYLLCIIGGFMITALIMIVFFGTRKAYKAFLRWRNPWKELNDFLEMD